MALATINSREYHFNCTDLDIVKTGNGRFDVTYDGRTFEVIGGTESGGSSHEWFVRHELFYGDRWLPVGSMVEAIKTGIQY